MVDRSFVSCVLVVGILVLGWCSTVPRSCEARDPRDPPSRPVGPSLDGTAERYVKLALALGQHDPIYVDAYYGPEAWQAAAKEDTMSLVAIEEAASPLVAELRGIDTTGEDSMLRLRREFLIKQCESLIARVRMLSGVAYTFDEQSAALFDVVAPRFNENHFSETLARIDSLVPPGEGSLAERFERYRKKFIIPKDRLKAVFSAAIEEARARTKRHLTLPADESFEVEYVTGKSWGAYNWYQGHDRSVIQINTDLPKYIDSAIGLACHEGYPGHHVQNVLFETDLVRARGWIEFTISPLFGPLSPINEGSANFGIEVAFPGDERLVFERDVLYPLAGIDTTGAGRYASIEKLMRELSSAETEAARRYVDHEISADDAARWLCTYELMSEERARKLVTFFDQFGSYVINYSVGYDLVKDYIEARGGTVDRPERRWVEFGALLSVPHVPSELRR
jgi:hypothetical protein